MRFYSAVFSQFILCSFKCPGCESTALTIEGKAFSPPPSLCLPLFVLILPLLYLFHAEEVRCSLISQGCGPPSNQLLMSLFKCSFNASQTLERFHKTLTLLACFLPFPAGRVTPLAEKREVYFLEFIVETCHTV